MKFDEFARKLNNEIESVQPNVLDKIKSSPITAENLGRGSVTALVWIKAKKFIMPVIYAICAVFVFIMCFSTISSDNVGASVFSYLNITIQDANEKSADVDFLLDKNGKIKKVVLGTTHNVDAAKIERAAISSVGLSVDEAISRFGNEFSIETASINVGVLNDSSSVAKSIGKEISEAIRGAFSAANVTSLTSGLTKDIIVTKTKAILKSATALMKTDELIKILFG